MTDDSSTWGSCNGTAIHFLNKTNDWVSRRNKWGYLEIVDAEVVREEERKKANRKRAIESFPYLLYDIKEPYSEQSIQEVEDAIELATNKHPELGEKFREMSRMKIIHIVEGIEKAEKEKQRLDLLHKIHIPQNAVSRKEELSMKEKLEKNDHLSFISELIAWNEKAEPCEGLKMVYLRDHIRMKIFEENKEHLNAEKLECWPEVSMLDIARKVKLPPLHVAREILQHHFEFRDKKAKKLIRNVINGKKVSWTFKGPNLKIKAFQDQINVCIEKDAMEKSTVRNERYSSRKKLEKDLLTFLHEKEIQFITKKQAMEIREEVSKELGCLYHIFKYLCQQKDVHMHVSRVREVLMPFLPCSYSPDFQLKKSVQINEKRVHWIDMNIEFGCGLEYRSSGQSKSLINKCERYVNMLGEGAILFSEGYSEALRLDLCQKGTICLQFQTGGSKV